MQLFVAISAFSLLLVCACSAFPEGDNASKPTMPALRAKIIEMANKDQALRKALAGNLPPSAEQIQKMAHSDNMHTEAIKRLIATHGWPTVTMLGQDGFNGLWLLVQHSTDDVWQRSQLSNIQEAFDRGDIDASSFALFIDRLLVREGKPQRYGTQIKQWIEGEPILYEMENRENVNLVRSSIGLFNLEDYLLLAKDAYFPGSVEELPFNKFDRLDEGGKLGFQLDIKGSGPLGSLVVQSLTVVQVATESPAADAGIRVGDKILSIDGLSVDGNTIGTLMPALNKAAGATVKLLVLNSDGKKELLIIPFVSELSEW